MKLYLTEKIYDDYGSELWTFDDETPSQIVKDLHDLDEFIEMISTGFEQYSVGNWHRRRTYFRGTSCENIFYENKLVAFIWMAYKRFLQIDYSSEIVDECISTIARRFQIRCDSVDCANPTQVQLIKLSYTNNWDKHVTKELLVEPKNVEEFIEALNNIDATNKNKVDSLTDLLVDWTYNKGMPTLNSSYYILFPNKYVLHFAHAFNAGDNSNPVFNVYKIIETTELEI